MISKFLNKLKSILFKSSVSSETPLKKAKKTTKSSKTSKTKKVDSKKIIESLTSLPGVGAKSAKALSTEDRGRAESKLCLECQRLFR